MDKERYQKGLAIRKQLFGDYLSPGAKAAKELAPDLLPLAWECIFGGIWARPGLDIKSRSMCTLSILTVLQREEELRQHIIGALNLGITKEQIIEIFMQMGFYAGIPVAKTALTIAKEVFEELKV